MIEADKLKEKPKIPVIPIGNNVLIEMCDSKSVLVLTNLCNYGWVRSIGLPITNADSSDIAGGGDMYPNFNARRLMVGDKVYLHHGERSGIKVDGNEKFILVPIENITAIVNE